MGLIRRISSLCLAVLFTATLPVVALAENHTGHWVSNPRALVSIVIGDDGGRISGPEWEHRFAAETTNLDFELAPGRRLILRRTEGGWVGEYFHPPIRPGDHPHEPHSMLFIKSKAALLDDLTKPLPTTTGASASD
jgi:hypothetical protein